MFPDYIQDLIQASRDGADSATCQIAVDPTPGADWARPLAALACAASGRCAQTVSLLPKEKQCQKGPFCADSDTAGTSPSHWHAPPHAASAWRSGFVGDRRRWESPCGKAAFTPRPPPPKGPSRPLAVTVGAAGLSDS